MSWELRQQDCLDELKKINERVSYAAYLDLKVVVQQSLELKGLLAIVGDDDGRAQTIPVERDAVEQTKRIRPQLLGLLGEGLGREAEIELDARRGAFGRRLAEELPAGVARESVLGELASAMVGAGTEDLCRFARTISQEQFATQSVSSRPHLQETRRGYHPSRGRSHPAWQPR